MARGKGVRDTLKVLIDLFGDIDCLAKHEKSIQLGISKTPIKDGDGDPVTLTDVKRHFSGDSIDELKLASEAAEVLFRLGQRLFIYEPCDQGDDSWSKRGQLTEVLRALSPIRDPHNAFNTVLNPEDREQLQLIVKGIQEHTLEHVERDHFTAVRDCLNYIESMTQIGSAFVSNLLDETKESLRRCLEALEHKAWNQINDKDWPGAAATVQRLARAAEELHPRPLSRTAADLQRKAQSQLEARKKEAAEMDEVIKQAHDAVDTLNARVKELQNQARKDQENMQHMAQKFSEQEHRRNEDERQAQAAYRDEMKQFQQRMLTANEQQKEMLKENMKRVEEEQRKRVKNLERQRENDKRNNEAELERLQRKSNENERILNAIRNGFCTDQNCKAKMMPGVKFCTTCGTEQLRQRFY